MRLGESLRNLAVGSYKAAADLTENLASLLGKPIKEVKDTQPMSKSDSPVMRRSQEPPVFYSRETSHIDIQADDMDLTPAGNKLQGAMVELLSQLPEAPPEQIISLLADISKHLLQFLDITEVHSFGDAELGVVMNQVFEKIEISSDQAEAIRKVFLEDQQASQVLCAVMSSNYIEITGSDGESLGLGTGQLSLSANALLTLIPPLVRTLAEKVSEGEGRDMIRAFDKQPDVDMTLFGKVFKELQKLE